VSAPCHSLDYDELWHFLSLSSLYPKDGIGWPPLQDLVTDCDAMLLSTYDMTKHVEMEVQLQK